MALFFWDANGDEPVYASGLNNGHLGSAVDLADLTGYNTSTMPLPNGVKAYVPGYGIYLFDSGSSESTNSPDVIKPTTGPGAWFLKIREGEFEAAGIGLSAFDGILNAANNVQEALDILDDIDASQIAIATPFDGHLNGDQTVQQALDTLDNLQINRLIVDESLRQSITFTAGTDISLTKSGSGTIADPYDIRIVNVGGGGGGAVTSIIEGTGISVLPGTGIGDVIINVNSDAGNVNLKQNGGIVENPAPPFGSPTTDPIFAPVTKGVSSGQIGAIPAKQTIEVCSESSVVARSIALIDSSGNNQAVNYQLSATVSGETIFDPAKVIINPTSGRITVSQGTSGGGGGITGIDITDFSDSPPTTYTDRTAINFSGFDVISTGPSNVNIGQPFYYEIIQVFTGNPTISPNTAHLSGGVIASYSLLANDWFPISATIDRGFFDTYNTKLLSCHAEFLVNSNIPGIPAFWEVLLYFKNDNPSSAITIPGVVYCYVTLINKRFTSLATIYNHANIMP